MTAGPRDGEPDPVNGSAGAAGAPGVLGAPECHHEVCVTCSDSAVPATVLRLVDGDLARVDTGAGETEVSVALVAARVGDTVLVHAGEAIALLGGEEP